MMRLHALLAAANLMGAGCYSPALRDCTVACTGSDDCAGDQVCGPQGFCVTEGVPCSAALADATPMPEAVTLRVMIDGIGQVRVDGVGTCSAIDGDVRGELEDGDCAWSVPPTPLVIEAIELDEEWPFQAWTTTTCADQPALCTITPASSITVGAKFL